MNILIGLLEMVLFFANIILFVVIIEWLNNREGQNENT